MGPNRRGWGHCTLELPSHASLVEGNPTAEVLCLVVLLFHVPQYRSKALTVGSCFYNIEEMRFSYNMALLPVQSSELVQWLWRQCHHVYIKLSSISCSTVRTVGRCQLSLLNLTASLPVLCMNFEKDADV